MNVVAEFIKELLLRGGIGISQIRIYIFCYIFVFTFLLLCYIVFSWKFIKCMKKSGRYHYVDEYNEDQFGTKLVTKIFIYITLIAIGIGLFLLIKFGIIENIAIKIANFVSNILSIPGHGEIPQINIE